MIGICRLFRAAACLKRAFCLSAHSTRALCCKIVTKSGELVMPAAAAAAAAATLHADRSDKRVCGRVEKESGSTMPLKATFPKSGFLG